MKEMQEIPMVLPKKYREPLRTIFPEDIDFDIPRFEKKHLQCKNMSLALKKRDCEQWFNEFVDKLINSCGQIGIFYNHNNLTSNIL